MKDIEEFFLNTILKISIAGVFVVLVTDIIFDPEDFLSPIIDAAILIACLIAYAIRKTKPTLSTFIVTLVVLAAMLYQCIVVPVNTTTSLSVILIVGFIHSVMLKGRTMLAMHIVTFLLINFIFVIQFFHPQKTFTNPVITTIGITYSILYFILIYATAQLKRAYDRMYYSLRQSHLQLDETAKEMAIQNVELLIAQEKLNSLNAQLETIIDERTAKIQDQNEKLLRYSYANAHHLRGPVARLLGLASVFHLEGKDNIEFIIKKIEEQANEIDAVVKKINIDLEGDES
jgi:prepilin signal peptidase PulO-like enzyme (type II secretory pathway)